MGTKKTFKFYEGRAIFKNFVVVFPSFLYGLTYHVILSLSLMRVFSLYFVLSFFLFNFNTFSHVLNEVKCYDKEHLKIK